jgi:branched-chain amino acid transport system ATP-binding protein
MTDALLEVEGLDAFYGPTRILHGVSFSIREGGITTLLGANGAGKTTTLRAVLGMARRAGRIAFRGKPIDHCATEDIVRLGFAHVPDGRGTFTAMTVEENLQLGAYSRRDHREIAADIERMYRRFPVLHERRSQQAGLLSGGEQQMLAIARALMLRPRILLLDEPSFGLAPRIVREIFSIVRDINRADGVSVLLVEQNASLALDLADHAYLLETGRVALAGSAEQIKRDESVRRSYLGY